MKTKINLELFWAKVNKSESGACWEWTAGTNDKGYGQFKVGRTSRSSHRISWELHNGTIPGGLFVLHSCDNPLCVNPVHLFLGTQQDNIADMMGKGRHFSKLTEDQVLEIRARNASGKFTHRELGDMYDVSIPTISSIVCRNKWKHI